MEFNRNKSRPLKTPGRIQVSKKVNPGFQRSSTQKFAKNFISPFTPYNGVLLFHEVGVGKTCAALGIAEGFRDYLSLNNKKILVLTPSETLIGSWKNEIFNVEKEIEKYDNNLSHNVQCTGNKYLREMVILIMRIKIDLKDKLIRLLINIMNLWDIKNLLILLKKHS